MRRSRARPAAIMAAGLAMSLHLGPLGCGGRKDTSEESLAAADPAPAEPAPAPAGGAEAAEVQPARAEPAPPASEPQSATRNATETDDLLAMARSSATAAPAGGAADPDSGPPTSGSPPPGASGSGNAYGPPGGSSLSPDDVPPPGDALLAYQRAQQGRNPSPSGAPWPSSPMPETASGQPGPGSEGSTSSAYGRGRGDRPGAPGEDSRGGPYDNPIKSAQTFLAAVKAKDPGKLADAIALRSISPMEGATQKHQTKYFKPILERSLDQDTLDELAAIFEGMQIICKNNPKSTGELVVILGKQGTSGKFATMTLYTRREKAGWKVKDFSPTRMTDHNPYTGTRMMPGRMPARGRGRR